MSSSEGLKAPIADINSLITDPGSAQSRPPVFTEDDDQASLFMHYLDHVFPLQFRFYQPSIWDGGRGWLLSTLMQTKPLYHAALSIAAYHRQSLFCPGLTDVERRCFELESLQEKHAVAIAGLRQYLEEVGPDIQNIKAVDNVKMLCCIALLISLEVSSLSFSHVQG